MNRTKHVGTDVHKGRMAWLYVDNRIGRDSSKTAVALSL